MSAGQVNPREFTLSIGHGARFLALIGFAAFLAVVALTAVAGEAEATHFRGGTLSWKHGDEPREVIFEGRFSWRWNYPTFEPRNPQVGDLVRLNWEFLRFGDGKTAEQLYLLVESVNPSANVMTGKLVWSGGREITHVYKTETNNGKPWVVTYDECCRLGAMNNNRHINNPDANYRLNVVVDLAGPTENDSPRTLVPPIVPCVMPGPCVFRIPATDVEGDLLHFTMALPDEAGPASATTPAFAQPVAPGLAPAAVGLANGLYFWNPAGISLLPDVHNLYSTQVHVSDGRNKVPTDFFIELLPPGSPIPAFSAGPCGKQRVIRAGSAESFDVSASSPVQNRHVYLNHLGLPAGAAFPLPAGANAVSSTFTWTPAAAQVGTYLVVFTIGDSSGYFGHFCAVEVVVVDTAAPIADFSPGTPDPTRGQAVLFTDLSTDPDGEVVAWSWHFGDGATSILQHPVHVYTAPGTYSVQLVVTDNTGISSRVTKDLVVSLNTPPVASFTADPTYSPIGGSVQFTDTSVDAEGPIAQRAWSFGDGSGSTLANPVHAYAAEGVYTVTLTVFDAGGLSDTTTRIVYVDGAPPTVAIAFTCAAWSATSAEWCLAPIADYAGTASDTLGLAHDPLCTANGPEAPCTGTVAGDGQHVATITARDFAGHVATATATIGIDTTPPTVVVPADLVLEATGPDGAVATFVVDAADATSGLASFVCDADSGEVFPLGATTVTCVATDVAGHTTTGTFSILVQDTTPPAITVPATIVLEATGPSGAVATFEATATDVATGVASLGCEAPSGSTFPLGASTVVCTATDGAGNVGAAAFGILVRDTTPPVVTPPANLAAYATTAGGAYVTYGPVPSNDLVDGAGTATCAPASGSLFPLGTTVVTCSATDRAGNTGTATFEVSVTFDWFHFRPPVMEGHAFNQGAQMPVKFCLAGASSVVNDAVARLYLAPVANGVVGTWIAAPGDGLKHSSEAHRFRMPFEGHGQGMSTGCGHGKAGDDNEHTPNDPTRSSGIYELNVETKDLAKGTWRLRLDLGDGVLRTRDIVIK